MHKKPPKNKHYLITQENDCLQITLFLKRDWPSVILTILGFIIFFAVGARLTWGSSPSGLFVLTLILGCLFFPIIKIIFISTLEALVDQQIISIDHQSIQFKARFFNRKLREEKLELYKACNLQVCSFVDKNSISRKQKLVKPEEIYGLCLFYEDIGGCALIENLDEFAAVEIIQAVLSYVPKLTHWRINENNLFLLVKSLVEFAFVSRYRQRPYNDLLSLSHVPEQILKTVFKDNPWLPIQLYAIADGIKANKSPKLDEIPSIYTPYFQFIWQEIAKNENTIWDDIQNIFDFLAKPIKSLSSFIFK